MSKRKREDEKVEDDAGGGKDWAALLASTTVGELVRAREATKPLVVVRSDATLQLTLDVLREHDILSVPVVRKRADGAAENDTKQHHRHHHHRHHHHRHHRRSRDHASDKKAAKDDAAIADAHKEAPLPHRDADECIGIVDVLDVLSFLHYHHGRGAGGAETLAVPVGRVLDFLGNDAPLTVAADAPVAAALAVFRAVPGTHRVLVVAAGDFNVLSQSDVLRFARQHAAVLPAVAGETLAALRLTRPTVNMFVDAPLGDVVEQLHRNKVSGMALLDAEGRVAGHLSASDLRGFRTFDHFAQSTFAFLVHIKQPPSTTLAIAPDATLRDAVDFVAKEGLHRVFISDGDKGHLRGIVTLTDIVQLL